MQSLRRVALRSASSAARAIATPKSPASQFVGQFAPKNAIAKQSAVSFARYFSQTARTAREESSSGEGITPASADGAGPEISQASTNTPNNNGIWIRNFVFDVNEDHLKELLSKFGTVVETKIVRDPRGLSRGFGFVYMSNELETDAAIAELNGSFWHGRRIHLERQRGTGPRPSRPGSGSAGSQNMTPSEPTRFIYIGNIPYEATDAELNRLFRSLDNLEDVRVAVDRVTGFPRGFAHADFTDVAAAQKAFDKLNGYEIGGRPLRVDFAGTAIEARKFKTIRNQQ